MVDNIAVVDRGDNVTHNNYGINSTRPHVVNSNIYNVEVTNEFKTATAKLRAGTLIKDDHFTLFESVGALEIGDPKMDSGCDEEANWLELDFDVTKRLEPTEVLWLMDELLCREVSWQMGYPLSQTLFTSYYIDSLLWPEPTQLSDAQFKQSPDERSPNQLVHVLLRAYCLTLLKCCGLTLTMVTGQHYYEEEDFASQLFNRDLLGKFSAESILKIADEATTWLHSADVDAELKAALVSHMQFRIHILKELARHATNPPATTRVGALNLGSIRYHDVKRQALDDAFSPKLQRRLASSVPPRPMITISMEEALQFWSNFCRHTSDAFAVRLADNSTDLLTSYLLFNAQDPQPSTYVRTLLQSFLMEDNKVCGRYTMSDLIREDLRSFALTSSPLIISAQDHELHPSSKYSIAWQLTASFLSKIDASYTNVYRTTCLNRSRLRRTLCHAVIEWDQIQAEAEELDEEIQNLIGEQPRRYLAGAEPTFSYPLSSWVYHFKLTQLRLLLQMGFELCVYSPNEMGGMYWYLAHICDIHLSHLERISHFVAVMEHDLSNSDQLSEIESSILQQCRTTTQTLYRHFGMLKATETLARALHGLYIAISRLDRGSKPAITYSSDQLRYEIRMRPFLHLSIPEPIRFPQFERLSSMHGKSVHAVLDSATEQAQTARRAWEEFPKMPWHAFPLSQDSSGDPEVMKKLWRDEYQGFVKSSIATSIAIDELRKCANGTMTAGVHGHKFKLALPQKGDRGYWHPFWIVPQITYT